jgi:uncharacterized protein YlxW (UPF0749 family)
MPDERPPTDRGASADQDTSGDEVGRQRVRDALRKPSRSQAIVGVLLACVGFAAITQVRTNDLDNSYTGYREQDLIDVLNGLSATSQRAQTELSRLERTRRDLEASSRRRNAALSAAQQQSDQLGMLAGAVPVTGPGIRVTVTEGPRAIDIDSILDAIEELRSAGAEAMQFNGKVRLVAQSTVQDGVGGLEIDGQLLTSPYVLDVIGDPHTLAGALTLIDGPISQLHDDGAEVKVEEEKAIDITTVRQPVSQQYTQPE